MDPYLEQHWRDVHHNLITFIQGELNERLPAGLRARVEERVFVESAQGVERSVYPAVRVIERAGAIAGNAMGEQGSAFAAPLAIHLDDEPVSQGYIEIVDAGSGGRVITVIEILSLSNKLPGEGQDLYRKKQRELRQASVSLVEIDLLRSGQRVLMVPTERIPVSHRTTYQICVRRGWQPNVVLVYRAPLRGPLPIIAIPLRETDADVILHLQPLIDRCYRHSRYDDIDYTREPDPPLDVTDGQWADALLRDAHLR
jgi:hypothetical protein